MVAPITSMWMPKLLHGMDRSKFKIFNIEIAMLFVDELNLLKAIQLLGYNKYLSLNVYWTS